ncbi:MAG: PDZ domain-containing protein [Candidatus Omnitrophica bacterium]|nr:PDZ domain-containing protein [Candidatus Omnitrophota bacterium]
MVRTKCILGFVLGLFILFLAGCATTSYNAKKSIWPPSHPYYQWYHYVPAKMASTEEAIGTIKNLEKNFVDWKAVVPFSSLDVDRYGLRAKWEWTETKQYSTYEPSYGGFFVGRRYIPTYSGSYRAHEHKEKHRDSLIIPFTEVSALILRYLPTTKRRFKWGLIVSLKDKKVIALRCLDEKSARQLANAITTLSNFDSLSMPRLGFGFRVLTAEQSEALNLGPGIGTLVYDVAIGSPAYKAGIKFLDVIMEIDGVPSEKYNYSKLKNPSKKSVSMKILRDGNYSIVEIPLF